MSRCFFRRTKQVRLLANARPLSLPVGAALIERRVFAGLVERQQHAGLFKALACCSDDERRALGALRNSASARSRAWKDVGPGMKLLCIERRIGQLRTLNAVAPKSRSRPLLLGDLTGVGTSVIVHGVAPTASLCLWRLRPPAPTGLRSLYPSPQGATLIGLTASPRRARSTTLCSPNSTSCLDRCRTQ